MGLCQPASGRVRAIVAIVALYALLLQPFLASATPSVGGDAFAAICAAHEADPSGAPDRPLSHDHPCCLAGQLPSLTTPPDPAAITAWLAPRAFSRLAHRLVADAPAPNPPTHAQSARGPPA